MITYKHRLLGKIRVRGFVIVRLKEKESVVAIVRNHNNVSSSNLENFLENIVAYYTGQTGVTTVSSPGVVLFDNSTVVKNLPVFIHHMFYWDSTTIQLCFYYCDSSGDTYTVTCADLNLEIAGYSFTFSTSSLSFTKMPCQTLGITWFITFKICPGANFYFCRYAGTGVSIGGGYTCAYPSNASNSYGGSSFIAPSVSIGVSPCFFYNPLCTTSGNTGYNFALASCGTSYRGYIYNTNLAYNGSSGLRLCVVLQEGCCPQSSTCPTPCQPVYLYEGLLNSSNQWLIWATCRAQGGNPCLVTTYVTICLLFVT